MSLNVNRNKREHPRLSVPGLAGVQMRKTKERKGTECVDPMPAMRARSVGFVRGAPVLKRHNLLTFRLKKKKKKKNQQLGETEKSKKVGSGTIDA